MTTQRDPNTKELSPAGLASQLFDAAILQYPSNPRAAVRTVISFLVEAVIYSVFVDTNGSEVDCRALLKSIADTIATAQPWAPSGGAGPSKP